MTAVAASPEHLDIVRVLQTTWDVLRRNLRTYFVVSLILAGAPSLLCGLGSLSWAYSPYYGFAGWRALGPAPAGMGLVSLVAGVVLQAALIYGAVNALNGRLVSVGESLRTGPRDLVPLIGVAIVYGVAVFIGMLLLVVPGVMIAIAWSVAAPAFVVERMPWMDAFGRSAELTRGSRWRILALFLVLLVIFIAVGIVVGIPAGILGWLAPPIRPLFQALSATVDAMVGAATAAALYVELRRLKEGVGPEGLAAAFD